MNLSAPKNVTWIIAVVAGLIGILGNFGILPIGGAMAIWLLIFGFALLVVATLFEGL